MSILKEKERVQTGTRDPARISKWARYGRVVLAPLKQEKKKLMLAAGLMVISVGLQLPLALVTRHIIDDLLPNKNIRGLDLVILTLLGVMILKDWWMSGRTTRCRSPERASSRTSRCDCSITCRV